jgi:signal transduction histidine kinase
VRAVADGRTFNAAANSKLAARTKNLEIDYTAVSLNRASRVRFRYKLDSVDAGWQNAGSRRQAFYSNLSPGRYRFVVSASNGDDLWNEAGAFLDFSVEAAYYQTTWFQASCVAAFLALLWGLYRLRLHQIARQFNVGLEERVRERTRIARELHDTLLQSFQGSLFEVLAARNLFPRRPDDAMQTLDEAIRSARAAIAEGRDAILNLRSNSATANGLVQQFAAVGQELSGVAASDGGSPAFRVTVEGTPRDLGIVLQDELYGIGREILRNAFHHARAREIEVEIRYDAQEFRIRFRDDGIGIDPKVL